MNNNNTLIKQSEASLEELMKLPLLTIKQAAQLLQVTTKTIHNKLDNNELPCLRIGRVVRIKRIELLNL